MNDRIALRCDTLLRAASCIDNGVTRNSSRVHAERDRATYFYDLNLDATSYELIIVRSRLSFPARGISLLIFARLRRFALADPRIRAAERAQTAIDLNGGPVTLF